MLESLRSDIDKARQRPRCVLGRFMHDLEPKDRKILEGLLADENVSAGEIANALKPYLEGTGLRLSNQGVGRHRRRGGSNGCACP